MSYDVNSKKPLTKYSGSRERYAFHRAVEAYAGDLVGFLEYFVVETETPLCMGDAKRLLASLRAAFESELEKEKR